MTGEWIDASSEESLSPDALFLSFLDEEEDKEEDEDRFERADAYERELGLELELDPDLFDEGRDLERDRELVLEFGAELRPRELERPLEGARLLHDLRENLS